MFFVKEKAKGKLATRFAARLGTCQKAVAWSFDALGLGLSLATVVITFAVNVPLERNPEIDQTDRSERPDGRARANMAVSSTRVFLQAFDKLFTPSLTLRKLGPGILQLQCPPGRPLFSHASQIHGRPVR